jgi:hypothetical protein
MHFESDETYLSLAPRSGCGFQIGLTRSGSLSLAHSGLSSEHACGVQNRSPETSEVVCQPLDSQRTQRFSTVEPSARADPR